MSITRDKVNKIGHLLIYIAIYYVKHNFQYLYNDILTPTFRINFSNF